MKYKALLALVVLPTLVLSAAFVTPTVAEAACSYNGYLNSSGKCIQSFPQSFQWSYQLNNRHYEYRDQSLLDLIEHLQDMIRRLENQLEDQEYSRDNLSVSTRSATNVDEDSATLRGSVYVNTSDDVDVYFVYGESRNDLDEETTHRTVDDRGNYYFETKVHNLDEDTKYYFKAVAEDEDGDEEYGSLYTFTTDDRSSNNDEEPSLNTHNATDIDEESAELHGTVDMNDFDNGRVFFVYGEDEDQIRDVEDDYDRYTEIDEDGDDLQKVLIDSDLDGSANYQEDVDGLDDNTDIYYSICVEYEDADDDVITCGDIESFETDS